MAQQHTIGKTNTTVKTIMGETTVTYYETAVVRFDDTTITLDMGGWNSATTKTRMNQTSHQFDLGYTVYQKRGDWFVDFKGRYSIPFDGQTLQLTR